jgi:diguanylate cyclase (GGDEF)-like protein
VIDIDHFKQINDRYGHEVGDAALKHVAQRIETMCPSPDRPGRLGGEEFVAMLDTGDKLQAHAVAEALRRAIEQQPFVAAGSEETITVSIGVATLLAADRNLDDLLRRADQALYVAKSGGRNRAVLAP